MKEKLVILLLVAAAIVFYYHQNKPTPKQPEEACSNLGQITDVVKGAVGGESEKLPDYQHLDRQYTWRVNQGEPFRIYVISQDPAAVYYRDRKVEVTDQLFKEKAIPKISSLGYTQNSLNGFALRDNGAVVGSKARYGFTIGSTKGQERLVVEILSAPDFPNNSKDIDFYKETGSIIEITCGLPDAMFDTYFDPILKVDKLPQDISVDISPPVGNAVKDNIVVLGLHYDGAGSEEFWYKDGDKWVKIHEGQTAPPCSAYESRKIGLGLNCVDNKTGQERPASF